MTKKYRVSKWTTEVSGEDLRNLREVELMNNSNPTIEFESEDLESAEKFFWNEILAISKYRNVITVYNVDCVELTLDELDDDGECIDSEYIDMRYAEPESDEELYDLLYGK